MVRVGDKGDCEWRRMEWPLDAGQGCRPWALLDQDDRAEDAAEGTAGGGEEGVRVASS